MNGELRQLSITADIAGDSRIDEDNISGERRIFTL